MLTNSRSLQALYASSICTKTPPALPCRLALTHHLMMALIGVRRTPQWTIFEIFMASELRRTPLKRSSAKPSSETAQEGSSNPQRTPGGPSSSNDPGLLLLVDPVDASVGALEVAISVVLLLDASDLAQKLASGRRQFL